MLASAVGTLKAQTPFMMKMTDTLQELVEDFLPQYMARYPGYARYQGFHEYDGRIVDMRQSSIDMWLTAVTAMQEHLNMVSSHKLSGVDLMDYDILRLWLAHEIFLLTEMQAHRRNPMAYLDNLEVSDYIKRDYAPFNQRVHGLVEHLRRIPAALEPAYTQLEPAVPRTFITTAMDMLQGQMTFINTTLNEVVVPRIKYDSLLWVDYDRARVQALDAIKRFYAYLETAMLPRATEDFAIGEERFLKLLQTGEGVEIGLLTLLDIGAADLARNKAAFVETARRINPDLSPREVVREMGKGHPSAEDLVAATRAMMADLRQFIIDRQIISVPYDEDCIVDLTPPYLRWAFAMLDSPGPMDNVAKEAYYYVTPPEADWTPEEQEEWLTMFNYPLLKNLGVHEAWPGHFLHSLHMRNAPSTMTRMSECYSFFEAWAHYCEQMMLEQDYHLGDDRVVLAQLSDALLRNVRYLVAIGMHCQGMTVEEATQRFVDDAFMEETPARTEAERGTYDPGYLNYTLGKLMLLKLREDYRHEQGDVFDLRAFHDTFLAYGAPPVPLVRRLMLRNDNGDVL